MPLKVYDYRTDVRNLFVTPQIRSRFLRMEPGQVADRHSHDLGHEIFLILAGRARFEIAGETAELGPGQLCVARVDEAHRVAVVGDEPMTMYLSVTPHVQPTHTGRSQDGERAPTRFLPSTAYDVDDDTPIPFEELVERFVDAAAQLATAANGAAEEQRMAGVRLVRAMATRDLEAADRQREILWFGVYRVFAKLFAMTALWNRLAPRSGSRP